MSNFKLEFTLRQHTPIIHFQSNQAGATLRATELKPKLDKFLIEQFRKEGIDYKPFLINGQENALDYKVKIVAIDKIEDDPKNKIYFGNIGKKEHDEDYRKTVFSKEPIKIEFFSFTKKILEEIEKYFTTFLAVTNFGTRQNKGYGSFYVNDRDKHYITPEEALKKINSKYIFIRYSNQNSQEVFSHIEIIYPLMKTGINYPDYPKKDHPKGYKDENGNIKQVPDPSKGRGLKATYYKSYLFSYMLKKNISNEKRFIKEMFFKPTIRIISDNLEKRYVRALLGISDGIEFKDHERKGKIEINNKEIERFKSPLTFKIIDNTIFIIAEEINQQIFNKSFAFSHKFKIKNEEKTDTQNIYTPERNEFDLVDFLYSFAEHFNKLTIKEDVKKQNFIDKKIEQAKKSKFQKAS